MNFVPKRDEVHSEVDFLVHVCNATAVPQAPHQTDTHWGSLEPQSYCAYQLSCKALIGSYVSLKPGGVFSLGSEFPYLVLLLLFGLSTVYKYNIQVFQPWSMKSFLMLAGYYKLHMH